jgi:hypothetical protein
LCVCVCIHTGSGSGVGSGSGSGSGSGIGSGTRWKAGSGSGIGSEINHSGSTTLLFFKATFELCSLNVGCLARVCSQEACSNIDKVDRKSPYSQSFSLVRENHYSGWESTDHRDQKASDITLTGIFPSLAGGEGWGSMFCTVWWKLKRACHTHFFGRAAELHYSINSSCQ